MSGPGSMVTGNVTIQLSEWMDKCRLLDEAGHTIAGLQADLRAARLADPSERVPQLVTGLRAARWVIALAMQYPAKAWPIAELRTFAEAFRALPDAAIDDEVTAIDMLKFCDEIESKGARQETAPVAGPDLDRNLVHGRRPDAPGAA